MIFLKKNKKEEGKMNEGFVTERENFWKLTTGLGTL